MEDWNREFYKPGGGNPFLFYVLFGNFAEEMTALSRSEYKTSGPPQGIEIMKYRRSEQGEVFDGFCLGYLWESLKKDSPALAEKVNKSDQCIVLRGNLEDEKSLNYFRDIIGLITYLMDNGGDCLYDPFMFKWWSEDEWKEKVFARDDNNPFLHTAILFSQEEDGIWYHTRGMIKFGRPDLSIHGVSDELAEASTEVIKRFIEFQSQGGVIKEGAEIQINGFPEGYKCFHRGTPDDPDFNNVHVEIEKG